MEHYDEPSNKGYHPDDRNDEEISGRTVHDLHVFRELCGRPYPGVPVSSYYIDIPADGRMVHLSACPVLAWDGNPGTH